MTNKKEYAKSLDGLIHLIAPCSDGYSLCGNAQEGVCINSEDTSDAWEPCKPAPITCPVCAAIILECRNVRVSPEVAKLVLQRMCF